MYCKVSFMFSSLGMTEFEEIGWLLVSDDFVSRAKKASRCGEFWKFVLADGSEVKF